MHSAGAAISGIFSVESFKYGYKHQHWLEYSLLAKIKNKKLADLNVKMAAIFKMAAILSIKIHAFE